MAHKSTKKGSNLLCRVANATPQKVCEYVRRLPKTIMPESRFRTLMGSGWFSNEHQAPEQWGLYYIDGVNYYPRFNRDISEKEAEKYLYGWIKRFIVINPYTRFKQTNDNNLVKSIVGYMEMNPNEHDLKAILSGIITNDEPFVLNEILANALTQYSEVVQISAVSKDDEAFHVELINGYKEILKTKYMTKKEYFDLFSDIQIANHDDEPRQQIFYGAPGTGKSHEIKEKTKGESVIRTTFHPDSDYSTFVGAYKPTMDDMDAKVVPVVLGESGTVFNKNEGTYKEKRIVYQFVMQAFLKAYLGAWKKFAEADGTEVKPQFLVIEEINRGNCAQIFGDLFQLLDRGKRGFSEYPIEADNDLRQEIERAFKEHKDYKLKEGVKINAEGVVEDYTSNYGATLSEDIQSGRVLLLPSNLYIWATMNTSDQSLFPIDSAFKRRWEWKYTPIAQGRDEKGNLMNWQIEGQGENSWWTFIQGINEVIDVTTHSEDKKLGFFFCKDQEGVIKKETFVNKVVFYLWNDVFKVYGFKSEIFDKKGKGDKTEKITFKSFYKDDGSVNEETMSVFVKNVMAKAPKENSNNDVPDESEEMSEASETEA